MWLAAGWVGWITGYRLGRRRGRFLPALSASGAITAILVGFLYPATRLRFGGDWIRYQNPDGGGIREWVSGALFVDMAFVLTALLTVSFLVEAGLDLRRRKGRWWLRWGVVLAVWMVFFIADRCFLLGVVDPWPPPAQKVYGLDPVTGRLWASYGSDHYWPWNRYLYALDFAGSSWPDPDEQAQTLYEVPSVKFGLDDIQYDRFAPCFLISRDRRSAPPETLCRTPRGVDTILLDDWARGVDTHLHKDMRRGRWYPVRCSDPTWFALPEMAYETRLLLDETGKTDREFRSRLLLYCPETGNSMAAVSYPGGPLRKTGPPKPVTVPGWAGAPGGPTQKAIPNERGWGYVAWPETALGPRTRGAIPVTFENSGDGDLHGIPMADGFLKAESPEPRDSTRVQAFLDREEYSRESPIAFRRNHPAAGARVQTIPSPDGTKGCVWNPGTAHLRVYAGGQCVESGIFDAAAGSAPTWSPDGAYLVYLSSRGRGQQSEWSLKLAYPEKRVLLEMGWAIHLSIRWSSDSKWLGVRNDTGHLGLPIVHFPDFSTEVLMPVASTPSQGGVRLLHDGSVAFVARDSGKIYTWRPEWEEPRCIYDPERKTVLTKSD